MATKTPSVKREFYCGNPRLKQKQNCFRWRKEGNWGSSLSFLGHLNRDTKGFTEHKMVSQIPAAAFRFFELPKLDLVHGLSNRGPNIPPATGPLQTLYEKHPLF